VPEILRCLCFMQFEWKCIFWWEVIMAVED